MGIGPRQAEKFAAMGFTPEGARVVTSARWTPARAEKWVEAGFTADEANAGRGWRPIYLDGHTLTPKQCRTLWDCGVTHLDRQDDPWIRKHGAEQLIRVARAFSKVPSAYPGGLNTVLRTGMVPEDLIKAARAGFTSAQSAHWFRHLGTDPRVWKKWNSAGLSAETAGVLTATFSTPNAATPWMKAGFSPRSAVGYASHDVRLLDAIQLRRQGSLPVDLDQPRPTVKWSEVISRSRGYSHVYSIRDTEQASRVGTAIADLGAETSEKRGLFSTWTDSAMVLDGGVYSSDGYGFGSLTGTWIYGDHALALICDRAGVSRPRGLNAPGRDELDQAWEEQRTLPIEDQPVSLNWVVGLQDLDDYAAGRPVERPRWDIDASRG